MKTLQFMAIKKYFLAFIIAGMLFCSCNPDKCICEKYALSMAKITNSDKSLYEEDIEIKCVGKYCCSRENGSNDWTIIKAKDANIISNYNKIKDPDKKYSYEEDSIYNLGFLGLSVDIFNIENIEDILIFESIIDSLLGASRPVSGIFFDEYQNNKLIIEYKDDLSKGVIIDLNKDINNVKTQGF